MVGAAVGGGHSINNNNISGGQHSDIPCRGIQ